MHILIDEFHICLENYLADNGIYLQFKQSCFRNDLLTETVEFAAYGNQIRIVNILSDGFRQIGFDLGSHKFIICRESSLTTIIFKLDITKDEMLELLAVLKLKGY